LADARIKGGPSQYPESLLRSPFSGSPGFADADILRPNVPTFDETWFRLAARLFAGFLPLMPNAEMNRVS